MDKIKIAFSGFWSEFQEYDNIFINLLKKSYEILIVDGEIENTDVLFYTNFSTDFYKYNCMRIFVTGENLVPDFNLCDYAIGFEQLYLGDRYIRYPLPYWNYRNDVFIAENRKNVDIENWMQRKFCSVVVSNGEYAEHFRNELIKTMVMKGKIDSGGRYLNNIEEENGVSDKFSFISKYCFNLALENCQHSGYCTEKIFQSFAAGCIPVYWGDPDIGKWFNKKAFINCNDFYSPKEVIDCIEHIAENKQKCYEMLMEPLYDKTQKQMEDYDKELEQWLMHIFSQGKSRWMRRAKNGSIIFYEEKIISGIAEKKSSFLERLKGIFGEKDI